MELNGFTLMKDDMKKENSTQENKTTEAVQSPFERLVMLHCLNPKCPKKKKVPLDKTDPPNTEHIAMWCPWHIEEGGLDYPTIYYDKDWKEINYSDHINSLYGNNIKSGNAT